MCTSTKSKLVLFHRLLDLRVTRVTVMFGHDRLKCLEVISAFIELLRCLYSRDALEI